MAVSDPTPASAARIANGASDADHWNFIWCTFSNTKAARCAIARAKARNDSSAAARALSILDQQRRE
jgi:hypothetical protein